MLARGIKWVGEPSSPGATLLGGANPAVDAHYAKERAARIEALFRHYGLAPKAPPAAGRDAVWDLLLALARAHVPGFRLTKPAKPKRKRGRPLGRVKRGTAPHREVFRGVELLRKRDPDLSVRAACAKLKRTGGPAFAALSVEALRSRHRAWAKLIGVTRKDLDPEVKKSLRHRWSGK